MRKLTLFLFLFLLTSCGCNHPATVQETTLCMIGTQHDSTELINPQALFTILEQVKPDVILCELDSAFFTSDFRLDREAFPDILSTNENIAAHRYQQEYGISLRPYEIEGRNEFYRETAYFERQNGMFAEIMNAFRENLLSEKSRVEWECYLQTVKLFDVFHNRTLEEVNKPLYVNYSEAKNRITYDTFVSITERDFPHWVETAEMMKSFWHKRNSGMAHNILTYCHEFEGKTIVVLTGQQHKAILLDLLQNSIEKGELSLKEFWEF